MITAEALRLYPLVRRIEREVGEDGLGEPIIAVTDIEPLQRTLLGLG